jgi:hypothetical protein
MSSLHVTGLRSLTRYCGSYRTSGDKHGNSSDITAMLLTKSGFRVNRACRVSLPLPVFVLLLLFVMVLLLLL